MARKSRTPQQRWAKKNRGKPNAACRRWRARYPERQKAATYRWRKRNLAKWNAYQRRWRSRNRHRTNLVLRAKRAALGEAHNTKRRAYRQRNFKKMRASARQYYEKNWVKKRIEHHRALAKRKKAIGSYTRREWRDLLAAYRYRCAYCNCRLTRKSASADHKIPLSRGGTNWIRNIVPACLPCNQRKNYLTAAAYLSRLRRKH